uniref:SnoaL-like domain-containing protein n=1 Tax=Alexandrium andersonii TaxID=327968 RepID=A0A7S2JCH1_9DINO
MAAEVVRAYILGTHGSLPTIDYASVGELLSDDLELIQEEASHGKKALLEQVYPGWASIVDGQSSVTLHAVAEAGDGTVLAHWETAYDVRDGSVWYGTDVDISGAKVRGFQVFASFTVVEGKIVRIVQRSDTVVKKLGIEAQVTAFRAKQSQ